MSFRRNITIKIPVFYVKKFLPLVIPVIISFLIVFTIFPKQRLIANLGNDQQYTEDLHPLAFELLGEKKEEIAEEIQALLKEEQIQGEINKVRTFFQRYGAAILGYEEIIVRKSHECGGDYRILVGIAGNESGLGRIPYKTFNPFGYLDGVQYGSWEESISKLSCVISQRFIAPCNSDLRCIINRYAGPSDDKELWLRNVTWFMQQVE